MRQVRILIMLLAVTTTTLQAQDNNLAGLLSSAREAFTNGEYRKH